MPEDMSRSVKHAAVELVVRYLGVRQLVIPGVLERFQPYRRLSLSS